MALTKVDTSMVESTGAFGRRNILINGDYSIAQRATSSTSIGANASTYYTADRWKLDMGGNNSGRVTMTAVVDDAPAESNVRTSLKLECTTADTSIAAGEYFILLQQIEGFNLQQFKKGTSGAKEFTVSFFVKGNGSATYVLELYDIDNGRQISKTFSVTSSWSKVELTFPADTTGAFGNDANASLNVSIWLHAGSDYTGGTLNSSAWAAQTAANRAAGISSFMSSTSNTLAITAFQLEVGNVATEFEQRSYGEELSLCQRYYCVVAKMTTTDYNQLPIMNCSYYLASQIFGVIHLPCQLRAAPSLEQATGTNYYRVFRSGSSDYFDGFTGIEGHANPISFAIYAASNISGTEGVAGWVETFNNAAYIAFDAEL